MRKAGVNDYAVNKARECRADQRSEPDYWPLEVNLSN
jgi:hypothetical protein